MKHFDIYSRWRSPRRFHDFALPDDMRDGLLHALYGALSMSGYVGLDSSDGLRYGATFVRDAWVLASPLERPRRCPIRPAMRAAVLLRDGGRCRRCAAGEDIQLDHIVPWSLGGEDTVDNLQCLCGRCNRAKWHEDKRAVSV